MAQNIILKLETNLGLNQGDQTKTVIFGPPNPNQKFTFIKIFNCFKQFTLLQNNVSNTFELLKQQLNQNTMLKVFIVRFLLEEKKQTVNKFKPRLFSPQSTQKQNFNEFGYNAIISREVFRITVLRPPQTSYGHHKNVRKNPYDARMKSVEVGGP